MKLIGAGFGRTGTTSLQAALEQLGLGPCYHMTELLRHPAHAASWKAAGLGQPVDWQAFLSSYQSIVDVPGCLFYRELMEHFPDAKVLLSVREPERWYDSCRETIYAISHIWPLWHIQPYLPRIGAIASVARKLVWQDFFHGRFLDRAFAIQMYNRHNEAVKSHVPPERLLVFDVKQGWEPLCRFLEVPVPQGVPFPHLNDTAEFKKRIVRIRLVSSAFGLSVLGGAVAFLWMLSRSRKK